MNLAISNKGTEVKDNKPKLLLVIGAVGLTLGIHYGWVLEPIFGHSGWVHAIHGRFCYIPIVVAASWFGIRGGVVTAAVVSLLVLPYIFLDLGHASNLSSELVEIVFYFAIAILTGALIDREWTIRKKQQQTQLQLERAHKLSMIGQMAAGIAHEIKNPLASIKGAVEIIGDKRTPEHEKNEFRQIALKEIKRADGTIHEFLQFARPKESRMENLDLSAALSSTIRQIETQAAAKGVYIKTDIEDGVMVSGDPEKIHQVFLNLLLNAMEASERGSTITISLQTTNEQTAIATVRDTGSGIAEEHASLIFDPFFTTKTTGSGLGLAVVKAIIENHRGTINISSKPGSGTSVSVSLPLLKERK